MGLDTSHGAYNGSYSGFSHFRDAICFALDGSYPTASRIIDGKQTFVCLRPNPEGDKPGYWYWGKGRNRRTNPGLWQLMNHSDCDGYLSPSTCRKIAAELPPLYAKIEEYQDKAAPDGWYLAKAKKFTQGCMEAAEKNQRLRFH